MPDFASVSLPPPPSPVIGIEARKNLSSRQPLAQIRRILLKVFPFQVVLTVMLVVLEFTLSRRGIADPDIWWHLRNAKDLLEKHQLPRSDSFSFTVAGHPWLNHEWLSELPYYAAWRTGGLVGVKSLSIFLIIGIFLGVLYLCYKASGNFKASVAACAFTTFLATVSFGPRTILFGYAYLVVLLIVLDRFRREGNAPLWLIPPLFCLWANTHGSWSLGLLIFSLIVAAGLVEGNWGSIEAKRWTWRQFRSLALTWVASVAALFVNPFGYRLVLYPLDLAFRQKLNIAHVAEWVSVDFHTLRGKIALVLIVVLLLSSLLRRRRWALAELIVFLFALYSGLTYIRFLFLLAIVAAPVLAKSLDFFPPYRPELETPIVNTVAVCLMLTAMVVFWPRTADLQKSVDQEYPSQALSYLNAHPPSYRSPLTRSIRARRFHI
jgi:hypothetical protein